MKEGLKMKDYYVYGYYRFDKQSFFYIGKGKGKRVRIIGSRTKHFKNIINSTDCVPVILYNNLDEQQAFDLEKKVIQNLLDMGYSIEINGYAKNRSHHLVNRTLGGEGISGKVFSSQSRQKMSISKQGVFDGEKNPMFGKRHSSEARQKMSASRKGRNLGSDNPNYGNKLSEEAKRRISEANKINSKGENNPNYNKGVQIRCEQLDKTFNNMKRAHEYLVDNYGFTMDYSLFARKIKKQGSYAFHLENDVLFFTK